MAELVGGAFLSAALQVAFQRLASPETLNYFQRKKLNDGLLKKLHIILISVNQVIEDAEEMQYKNPNVKKWLDELRDEVFKAEDLLDEIATEASLQKLYAESHIVTNKVRGFFAPFLNAFEKNLESRIKELLDNLEYLINQNEILGLTRSSGVGSEVGINRKPMKRLPTTSLVDESKVCGRDTDQEKIIEKLLSHSDVGGNRTVNVIAITAMGGMGKTTLARLVYEDTRIRDQFQLRAWKCISEEYYVVQITRAILHALDCKTNDYDDHQLKLKERLMGKKFLLVLDDVWSESRRDWEFLQAPLKYGALGSKILVTTRNRKVAEVMHSTYIHLLKPLQDEECWRLFAKHAFGDQHNVSNLDLESIGKDIVKKCGGLPLAIKTLGSLLHTKLSRQAWEKILKSDMWDFSEDDSNIIPSLRLSYHYLPSYLKRCFAFCSIFPKDYEIDKDVLIQLWMAEGLLHSSHKGQSMEEVGYEFLKDLESRSFFEPSKSDEDHIIMHDLLNDLAKSVIGEFCLQIDGDRKQDIAIKTRYLSCLGIDGCIFKPISNCNQLHSFISLKKKIGQQTSVKNLHDLVSGLARLNYIRVLSFNGFDVEKLAIDIRNLRHLRYLDISYSQIRKLPNSICLMINLQTLKLKKCSRLTKLPSDLHKLINLSHLDLECSGIRKMPKYMGRLEQLRIMTQFVVGENRASDLKELGALNRLRGKLTLSKMENIIDLVNAKEVKMKDKQLDELKLHWEVIQNGEKAQHQECVMEDLQPNSNLKKFTVDCYVGTRFPNWFDGSSFPNLVSLKLRGCISLVKLPPLGQLPSLQRLDIAKCDGIKVIDRDFYGNESSTSSAPFRSLSYMSFEHMEEWREWNLFDDGECFSSLQELYIMDCPKLTKSLPQHLPSLKKLLIDRCKNLEASLPRASALEELSLEWCEKISLKDMSTCNQCSQSQLPLLHSLTLIDCPAIESPPQSSLLPSLRNLIIGNCPKLIASRISSWSLRHLLCLEHFTVGDNFENVESFPEEGLLPPNVQSLILWRCSKLKTINCKGLLHLHSLKSLTIWECRELTLEGLPEEGLPASISHLNIYGCPLLKWRCQRETGPDWPKISHIPHIDIP